MNVIRMLEGKPVKQITVNICETFDERFPEISFSGTKYDPILIITGTDDQIKTFVSLIWREMESDPNGTD
jgi:hypothetical protein